MSIKIQVGSEVINLPNIPNTTLSSAEGTHVSVGQYSTGLYTRGVQQIEVYTHPTNSTSLRLSSTLGSRAIGRLPDGQTVTAQRTGT